MLHKILKYLYMLALAAVIVVPVSIMVYQELKESRRQQKEQWELRKNSK